MAINFRSKFDELFGEGSVMPSAPSLRDVAPGLVSAGTAKYASKELNPRRTAVSGRHFRSARTRSQGFMSPEEMAATQGALQSPTIAPQTGEYFGRQDAGAGDGLAPFSGRSGGFEGGNSDGGDRSPIGGVVATPQSTGLDLAVGDEVAGQIGSSLGTNIGMGAAGSLLAGQGLGGALSGAIGSGLSGLAGPLGILGLANTAIGSSMAADDAMRGAIFGETPEAQERLALGTFETQPKTVTGRIAASMGFGDRGVEGYQAALASDQPSAFDRPIGEVPTSAELVESMAPMPGPFETEAAFQNRLTGMEIDNAYAEALEPSMLQKIGFTAPDANVAARATVDPVEQGFSTGGPITDTGNQAISTGGGLTETGALVGDTNVAQQAETSVATADPTQAASLVGSGRPDIREVEATAERERLAAEQAESQRISGLESQLQAAQRDYNRLSTRMKERIGGDLKRQISSLQSQLGGTSSTAAPTRSFNTGGSGGFGFGAYSPGGSLGPQGTPGSAGMDSGPGAK